MGKKLFSLLAAVSAGLLVYLLSPGLPEEAARLLGLLTATVLAWLLEVAPLGVVALAAAAATVPLGLADKKEAFANFAHPIIFLFIGSFLLAEAFSKYRLDRYLALKVLKRPAVRRHELLFVAVVLFVPWFLSMWLSNTATTAMLLPIVAGMLAALYPDGSWVSGRAKFLLLGIAYASSIGGIATPVGTPPNLIALGFLEKEGISVSFGEWILKALPVSVLTLLFLLFLVKRLVGRLPTERLELPREEPGLNFTQKVVLFVFLSVVFLWLLPSLTGVLKNAWPPLEELHAFLKTHLHYSVVAVLGAALLFVLPDPARKRPVLEVSDLKRIDWDTILLFGGGLTLGSLMFKTGLVHHFGQKLGSILPSSEWAVLFVLALVAVFLTEVSSNTATTNVLVPVVLGLAHQLGLDPLKAVAATTLACSYAFMLPMATPPNAIVFGFANFKISEMAKVGFVLNLFGAFVIATLVWLIW
ncbi:MAG: SLC13/DASS family transporter [Aquificae bacterium]|nr:SLC13/DASS family transporter [Aquificota bacterium]